MSPPPSSHPGPAWRGEEVDDGCSLHHHSSYNFLSCHWLSVPLSDHTPLPPVPTPPTTTTSPPPSPPPHGPSLLRRLRLSLGCFEHSPPFALFFCFFFARGGGLSALWCCCMLALSSSTPRPPPAAAIQRRWRRRRRCWWWWWWCSVSLPSSLLFASSLLCSVNPHCLVVLFELT